WATGTRAGSPPGCCRPGYRPEPARRNGPAGGSVRPPGCPSGVQAEAGELLGVALPVLGHLDVQVEVDAGTQQGLDLLPGPAADVLQAGALGADDDGLLAGALDIHLGVDVGQVLLTGPRLHLLDDDRDRVRELFADTLQGGLADQLGDQEL